MVEYMIEARERVVRDVFKFIDGTTINIPVHFRRIINNIHNQLSIQSNSLVNITPIELYELLMKHLINLQEIIMHRLQNYLKSHITIIFHQKHY